MDTATLDDLRKHLFDQYPQYADDECLEIRVYSGQPRPELICDNRDLGELQAQADSLTGNSKQDFFRLDVQGCDF